MSSKSRAPRAASRRRRSRRAIAPAGLPSAQRCLRCMVSPVVIAAPVTSPANVWPKGVRAKPSAEICRIEASTALSRKARRRAAWPPRRRASARAQARPPPSARRAPPPSCRRARSRFRRKRLGARIRLAMQQFPRPLDGGARQPRREFLRQARLDARRGQTFRRDRTHRPGRSPTPPSPRRSAPRSRPIRPHPPPDSSACASDRWPGSTPGLG